MKQKLFSIFVQSGCTDSKLFDAVYALLNELIVESQEKALGTTNAEFFEVLSKLRDGINNAGHEKRRLDDISLINDKMHEIAQKYEEYLP